MLEIQDIRIRNNSRSKADRMPMTMVITIFEKLEQVQPALNPYF